MHRESRSYRSALERLTSAQKPGAGVPAYLRWVNRALRKMDLGTYGICERCGNPVSIERLEALPWAILCIDCARLGEGR